jgi:hypothetical protein
MMTMRDTNQGEFQEKEYGNYFTYRKTDNPWAIQNNLMHEVDVGDGGVRFANVLKTVAHVCIDEDSEGKAVLDTWKIKKHILYIK